MGMDNKLNEEQVVGKVKEILAEVTGLEVNEIGLDSRLRRDLGLDSIDKCVLTYMVEDEFDIILPDQNAHNFKTVRDVVKHICKELEIEPSQKVKKSKTCQKTDDAEKPEKPVYFLI